MCWLIFGCDMICPPTVNIKAETLKAAPSCAVLELKPNFKGRDEISGQNGCDTSRTRHQTHSDGHNLNPNNKSDVYICHTIEKGTIIDNMDDYNWPSSRLDTSPTDSWEETSCFDPAQARHEPAPTPNPQKVGNDCRNGHSSTRSYFLNSKHGFQRRSRIESIDSCPKQTRHPRQIHTHETSIARNTQTCVPRAVYHVD